MKTIEKITTIIISTLTYLFGGFDSLLKVLLIFMLLDYISGICKAIYHKELNSKIGIKGIIKKIGYLTIVVISSLLDNIIKDTSAIRTLVIYFFIANEGISIIENYASLNLPLPKKLLEVFKKLKEEENNT